MFSFSFLFFSLSRALTVSYILSHLSPVLPYPPFFLFFSLLSPLYSPHLSMLLSISFYPRTPPPFISPFLFSSKCLSFFFFLLLTVLLSCHPRIPIKHSTLKCFLSCWISTLPQSPPSHISHIYTYDRLFFYPPSIAVPIASALISLFFTPRVVSSFQLT